MVTFKIIDVNGAAHTLEAPADMNLSLMEVLKASEYNIPATCGGIALCATCHVEVVKGSEALAEASDAELEMIDTLPNATASSRLACQLRIGSHLEGAVFALTGQDQ
jgi:ferredoxin